VVPPQFDRKRKVCDPHCAR